MRSPNPQIPRNRYPSPAPPARKGRVYPCAPTSRLTVLAAVLVLAACGGGLAEGTLPVPHPEASASADVALETTRPSEPTRIRFGFRVREQDLRFNGQGVARVEPPYRVRLDLFSNGGEAIFQAALVEGNLRVPAWAPRELAPPPALLWAAFGVFRPDPDLNLLEGRAGEGKVLTLRYGGEEDLELRFRFEETRLTRAELHREGHLVEEVDLFHDEADGKVLETVYRNRALFLELTFSLESTENVPSFPAEIWYPGR